MWGQSIAKFLRQRNFTDDDSVGRCENTVSVAEDEWNARPRARPFSKAGLISHYGYDE